MKRFLIILISFITVSSLTAAEHTVFNSNEFLEISKKSSSIQSDEIGIEFELLKSKASEIFKAGPKTLEIHDFPMASGLEVDIRLKKERSVVSKDAVIKTTGKDGEKRRELPDVNSYSGSIIGQHGTKVFLNYSELGIIGFIQDIDGETFNISPGILESSNKIKHSVVQTSIEDVMNELNASYCGVSDYSDEEIEHEHDHNINNKNNKVQDKERLLEVKMAADGNFEFFLMFCQRVVGGGINNWLHDGNEEGWFLKMTDEEKDEAEDLAFVYMNNIMSAASKIYEVEANVTLKLVYANIYLHPDFCPYFNETFGENLSKKLDLMGSVWLNKDDVPPRALATLFSDTKRQPSNSNTLGIAKTGNYNGALCSSQGYSALGMTGNANFPRVHYAQDVQVAVHEFGHNFGCPHTHNCNLAGHIGYQGGGTIDSCVTPVNFPNYNEGGCLEGVPRVRKQDGTIMSYCHIGGGGIVYKFHPAMRAHIRNRALDIEGTNCNLTPDDPILVLKRPIGTEDFFGGTTEDIKFNAAHVSSASLYYSINNGNDWILIDDDVNTADNEVYEWQVPEELSNIALVRIESNANASVFDQSVVTFNITTKAVTAQYPQEGDEVGYIEDQQIRWQKTNVDRVNVKYSLDDGNSWETIASNTKNLNTTYNFPDQSKDNVLLLIEDAEGSGEVSQVISFDLGKENVVFNAPKPGKKYCKQFLDNDIFEVKFEKEYIETFDLQISLDGGNNWKAITNFGNQVKEGSNVFEWDYESHIEGKDSAFIIMRAILKSDPDVVVGEVTDEEFIIKQCATFVDEYNFSNRFKINNISPNPTSNDVNINIFNGFESSKKFKVKIINTNGKVFYETDYKFAFSGNSVLNIDTQDLNPGSYFILLESDEYQDVQQLQIIR